MLSSQMTKTFRDNCDKNIVQQTSCEPLSQRSNAVKNVLFCSFCTPMYESQLWCNFRKSCMQRLCLAYNFGCRALYNLPWRASVSSHQVQCNIPTYEALLRKNHTSFSKDAGSRTTTYDCMHWCSPIVYILSANKITVLLILNNGILFQVFIIRKKIETFPVFSFETFHYNILSVNKILASVLSRLCSIENIL